MRHRFERDSRCRYLAIAAVALPLLGASAAGAADLARVAVLPTSAAPGVPAGSGTAFDKSLRDSLTRAPGITGVSGELFSSVPAGTETGSLSAQLAEAQEHYDALDLDPAIELLRSLRDEIEPRIASLDDDGLLPEVLLLLAMAELANGDAAAAGTFSAYAGLRPDAALSPDEYPPPVLKVFRKASKSLVRGGILEIESTPTGAAVRLDGRARGTSPLELDNVPIGKHLVRIVAPGYRPHGVVVEVFEGDIASVVGTLTPDDIGTALAELERMLSEDATAPDVAPTLGRMAADLSVDAVILPLIEPLGAGYMLSALAVEPGERTFRTLAVTSVDATLRELSVATALLAAIITEGGKTSAVRVRSPGGDTPPLPTVSGEAPLRSLAAPAAPAATETAPREKGKVPKLLTRWWLWAAVAGVAGVAVVTGLAAGGAFTSTLTVDTTLPEWSAP